MGFARTSIIPRSAMVSALISAAACAPRSHEPLAIVPVTEVCDTIVTDSTGPHPRVPEVESIAPGRGAMIGVAMDAQMGYALGRTIIHFTGRSENWVLTDSVGRFVMNELPPGLYLLDAVRIGYRHAYFTATVRRGQVTAVALPLRKEVCGIVRPTGRLPGARQLGFDQRATLEDRIRERAEWSRLLYSEPDTPRRASAGIEVTPDHQVARGCGCGLGGLIPKHHPELLSAPPARDLEEAAGLAALHSKARSSGTVAVDWTRRKNVRKPRGAPPGRVMISHAKTLFVQPDAALEERLRMDGDTGAA